MTRRAHTPSPTQQRLHDGMLYALQWTAAALLTGLLWEAMYWSVQP